MNETIEFVVKAHAGQTRQGSGLPYVVHPIEVTKKVADWGIKDSDILNAALCHDVLEDCPRISFEALVSQIGEKAANIVRELTFTVETVKVFVSYGSMMSQTETVLPHHIQKENYMKSFGAKSLSALVIKMADRICNTIDFINDGNRDYACKYWKKAESLFHTFREQESRIDNEFGKIVFERINEERCRVIKLLGEKMPGVSYTGIKEDGSVTSLTEENLKKRNEFFTWITAVGGIAGWSKDEIAQRVSDPSWFFCFDDGMTPEQALAEAKSKGVV